MGSATDRFASTFDDRHYASSLGRKVIRAAQLGFPYYCWQVPRYFWVRHKLGLRSLDVGVLRNPFREFVLGDGLADHPKPPHYTEALTAFAAARIRLSIPPARLAGLSKAWWLSTGTGGDVIECGSYEGATGLFLALLGRLNEIDQRVVMLDTFAGEPAHSRFDVSRGKPEFQTSSNQVAAIESQAMALGIRARVEVHAGLFAQTFQIPAVHHVRLAFAHIDANLYSSTLEACQFVMPRMNEGGFVVFDDYNGVADLGARLAIDVFRNSWPFNPMPLVATSAFVELPRKTAGLT